MIRYHGLVKQLDRGEISVQQFCNRIFPSGISDIFQLAACYRIYAEDGGRLWDWQDFVRAYPQVQDADDEAKRIAEQFAVCGVDWNEQRRI